MYNAFISYSHAADGKLAPALQTALEKFAKPWYKVRYLNVFRDEASLTASPHLWNNIQKALDQSEYLIYMASPTSANSKWVVKEIEHWLATKSVDNILIALTDGDIFWDDTISTFNSSSNSLPAILKSSFKDEPFYVDFRNVRTQEDLSLNNSLFKKEVLKLAAHLHGMQPKDLASEEVFAHRKMIRIRNGAISVLSVLLFIAIGAAWLATKNAKEAERQKNIAIENAVEAKRQENFATENAVEAKRQENFATENAVEAKRQENFATEKAEEAERQKNVAIKNKKEAEYRAIQSEYRRLLGVVDGLPKERNELALLLLAEATDLQQLGNLDDHDLLRAYYQYIGSTTPRIVRFAHQAPITHTEFSPDGKYYLTSSYDGTAKLWTINGFEKPIVLDENSDGLVMARFSPDGKKILTAGFDGSISLYDINKLDEPIEFVGHKDEITYAEFSPNGRYFVSTAFDKTARIWDVNGIQEQIVLIGHKNHEVKYATFSPDGLKVVTTSKDSTVRIWNTNGSGNPIVLRDHKGEVNMAKFSPNGKIFATASSDSTVILWDAHNYKKIKGLNGYNGSVYKIEFNEDGTKLLTIAGDSKILIWAITYNSESNNNTQVHISDNPLIFELKDEHINYPNIDFLNGVNSATFNKDGSKVIISWGKKIQIGDFNSGEIDLELQADGLNIGSPCFSPDGKLVLAATSDGNIRIWRLNDYNGIIKIGMDNNFSSVADLNPDGNRVLKVIDNNVQIWNVKSLEIEVVLKGHEDIIRSAQFSSDGNFIVTSSNDKTVRVWNSSGKLEKIFKGHKDDLRNATFSHNNKLVVSASDDNTGIIWTVFADLPPIILSGHKDVVTYACFSPDDKYVVTSSWDGTARVWDVSNGNSISTLRGHWDNLDYAEFSSDGMKIVTASRDNTARVWKFFELDPTSIPLIGHKGDVEMAVFNPEGNRIITAANDNTAIIWEIDNNTEPILLRTAGVVVKYAKFSPDGKRIIIRADDAVYIWRGSGGGEPLIINIPSLMGYGTSCFSKDGTKLLISGWNNTSLLTLSVLELREIACILVGRNLTHEEWAQYLTGEYRNTFKELPSTGYWTPPQQGIIHGPVRIFSSGESSESSLLIGRDENFLYPREIEAKVIVTSKNSPLLIGMKSSFSF